MHCPPFDILTRTPPPSTLFPYTTLFRSHPRARHAAGMEGALWLRLRAGAPRSLVARAGLGPGDGAIELLPFRSEEHTSELQSHSDIVCRLLLEKKKKVDLSAIHQHIESC